MNNGLMFSSKDQTWETPQKLFDELDYEFNFNLDACALDFNKKCDNYYDPEDNALEQKWVGDVWMNPPYERGVQSKFIEKAYMESLHGSRVVCLIPSRTDTKSWHDYVMKADEIRFVKGRLKFGNAKDAAPFPSAIVIFNKNTKEHPTISTYEPTEQPALNKVIYYHNINPMKYIE